jgi:3-oxoacyl-(acyl-carrier-protein) synthase
MNLQKMNPAKFGVFMVLMTPDLATEAKQKIYIIGLGATSAQEYTIKSPRPVMGGYIWRLT